MARPRQISDEQILTAMRTAVLAHGPAVSLDQVAASLNVTAPALLKRFGSRQKLLLESLRPPEKVEWIERLDAGPTEEDFRTQLLGHLRSIADFLNLVVPCVSALRESGVSPESIFSRNQPAIAGLQALERWLRKARKLGLIAARETDSAAAAILGAVQNRAFFAHVMKQEFSAASQRRYHEELAELFCRALDARLNKTKSRRNTVAARTP